MDADHPDVLLKERQQLGEEDPGLGTAEIVERPDPIPLAEHFIDAHHRDDRGRPLLRRWRGDWWRWTGAAYEHLSDEALDAQLYSHLDQLWTLGANDRVVKIRAADRLVRDVRLAMPSRDLLLPDSLDEPAWLDEMHDQDPRKMIPCKNGLLDLASFGLLPATSGFFTVNSVPYDYDPHAPQPTTWLRFLNQLWPDDLGSIELLREWFAYILSPETRLQKILLIVGPRRSGKGTAARVLKAMIGAANVAAPTMASFATNFGLQSLLHRRLAIIPDARLSGRTDQAVVVERLLSISGEDPITVDRKYKESLTVTLPTRIMLLTNELPRLADTSGALASRFLVLTLTRSFYGQEDHELTDKILAELPGVLNWALVGWEQLQTRGRFAQPESSREAIESMEDLASPMSVFIRDRCTVDPAGEVECGAIFKAWEAWCEENGRERPGTVQTFARDLRAALPGIGVRQPRTPGGGRDRFYQGVTLNGTA